MYTANVRSDNLVWSLTNPDQTGQHGTHGQYMANLVNNQIRNTVPVVLRKVSVQQEGLAKINLFGIFWSFLKSFQKIE